MSWINVISEKKAIGRLKRLYDQMTEPWGGVDNILKIHSLNPRSLKAHFDLYKSAMAPTISLDLQKREMIALVVSSLNQCHY